MVTNVKNKIKKLKFKRQTSKHERCEMIQKNLSRCRQLQGPVEIGNNYVKDKQKRKESKGKQGSKSKERK